MGFSNVYDDPRRASAYAVLDYPGTYYLAFRDLPEIIGAHVRGNEALDFGCGAGRSTRFLEKLGFKTAGVDISSSMIELAKANAPSGQYFLIGDGDFAALGERRFDLILSAFAFDNIPDAGKRAAMLRRLGDLLNEQGRIVLLGSTPEIYCQEWASFTTKAFPENRGAKSGEPVRIVMKDVADARPVIDLVWFHDDYLKLFAEAGLELVAQFTPLGRAEEPIDWISETTIAPWVIYVAGKRPAARKPSPV